MRSGNAKEITLKTDYLQIERIIRSMHRLLMTGLTFDNKKEAMKHIYKPPNVFYSQVFEIILK